MSERRPPRPGQGRGQPPRQDGPSRPWGDRAERPRSAGQSDRSQSGERPARPRSAEPADRGDRPWAERAPRGATPTRARDLPPRGRPAAESPEWPASEPGVETAAPRGPRELRLYGLNAVHAVFAKRPDAIRKLYLTESRIPALKPLLAWCVAHRVGYRVVEDADLEKLSASAHHEGVVADVLRAEPESLSTWLRDLPAGPQLAIWLDGVGNPHNLGAILRSAAHFGVSAVLLPKHSPLALSGAAARVAEGGAEHVPMVRLGRTDNALAQLRGAGFTLAATVVKGGRDVFATELPQRVVYVVGAEGEGMDRELAAACDLQVSIPGTGAVESLNVASATAVLLAAWRARQREP
ncbi:TrmH family RNA methyltransferase [Aerolutibacter daejeonensis]|uniref:TrmH family RNA methyltransferase n=1 Tax=Aerolutibacter daejeonensis TaxID=346181 RepID=UPI000A03075C